MPIIPTVGRKTLRIRMILAAIYLLLIVGGVTMVVPFAIVLTSSISNEADYERFDPVPTWFWRRDLRYAKYLAEKYRLIRFEHFAVAHGAPAGWSAFDDLGFEVDLDQRLFGTARSPAGRLERIADDYHEFLADYDPANCFPLFSGWSKRDLQRFLRRKYERQARRDAPPGKGTEPSGGKLSDAALDLLSRAWNEGIYTYWDLLNFDRELSYPYHLPRWVPLDEPRHRDYLEYVAALPASHKLPVTTRYLWCLYLLNEGIQVDQIDRRHATSFESIYRVPPGDVAELPEPLAKLWRRFLAEAWPVRLIELTDRAAAGFPDYLRERFKTVDAMNKELGADLPSFAAAGQPRRLPERHALRRGWIDFVLTTPLSARTYLSAERAYRVFLKARYGSAAAVNEAYGWRLASLDRAELPQRQIDYLDFTRREGDCTWNFFTANFAEVVQFIAGRGRALWNTLILVALTIFFTLTVNPMAAYALSRFRLRLTQQILIYLLATMAFPPEVGMIPGFLLLRDLHLLNTFPALILPGVANGFSIFLLKGFFDSLPTELYEAAAIDGAGETRMFLQITLPLCKPILAVIALTAFIRAYGGFMWAFLVCQDPDMWTLMVWLYQFQAVGTNPPQQIMAALVVASILTLLVFVVCQKIILRGIIIPTMK